PPLAAGPAVAFKTAAASTLALSPGQSPRPSPPAVGGQLLLAVPNVLSATNDGLITPDSRDWLRKSQMNPGMGIYNKIDQGSSPDPV
ncbi:MAG TPA: hypothetical protein VLR91_10540, partial [Thermodesulfobacteriota bacterium]|nr:hypothetical protein [Thermodesulfobacteriota bacterium]